MASRNCSQLITYGLVLLGIFGCVCGPSIPQADTCNAPSNAGIETLELGIGEDGPFRPLDAGAKLILVRGGQGARMLPLRLRVGPNAPPCIDQVVTVASAYDHKLLASVGVPTSTYAENGGARVTKTMYLIEQSFDSSFTPRVQVVAKVAGVTLEQTFATDVSNGCAAIVRCSQSCTFDCDQCSAGASAEALAARDRVEECVSRYCSPDGGGVDGGPDGGVDGGTSAGNPDAGGGCPVEAQTSTLCKTTYDECKAAR